MWQAAFWKDALERAIRTVAQVLGALVVAAGTGLLGTDWIASFSAAGMAGVLSILTSLAGEARSPDGTASLLRTKPVPQPEPPEAQRDSVPG